MIPLRRIRRLLVFQLVVGLTGVVTAGGIAGRLDALSFGLGAALSMASVALLASAVDRMLAQKTVAWTVTLIISKYALLLSSIFYLTRTGWFSTTAGGLGIASFIISAFLMAVFDREKE